MSRLIGVPANDIKKRVLGVRGAPTTVIVESGPWWVGTMCTVSAKEAGGMWRRCGHTAEANGYCWEHRHFRTPTHMLKLYTDPYLESLAKRWPVRYMDEIVWVDSEGTVLRNGEIVKTLTIDLKTGIGFERSC